MTFLFLPSFMNTLLKASPNWEYWNIIFSRTFSLYRKSSPVKYSYFSNSPLDNADSSAALGF